MNDIEVDFTYPNDEINVDPITTDDYDFDIFAVKGDKGDAGQDGTNGQDGKGIASVSKTSTSGLVDTYTITYTDNTTSTFEVTNGANGQDGTNGQDGADGRDGVIQYTAGDNITIENNVISAVAGASNVYNWGSTSLYTQQNPLDLTGLEKGLYSICWDTNYLYVKVTFNNSETTLTKTIDKPQYLSYNKYSNMSLFEIQNKITRETEITGTSRVNFFTIHTFLFSSTYQAFAFIDSYYRVYPTYFYDYGGTTLLEFVSKSTNQTIDGVKTFNSLPECTAVPTTDGQLVNKKYVDDNASAGGDGYNLGRTSDYTEANRLDLTGKKEGLYIIDWVSSPLYYQVSYNNTTYTGTLARPTISINNNIFSNLVFLELANKIESSDTIYANMPKTFFALKTLNYNLSNRDITFYAITYTATSTGLTNSASNDNFTVVTVNGSQQITGVKTFNNLPQSSKVPTDDKQLVNKKYVDDAIAAAIANL